MSICNCPRVPATTQAELVKSFVPEAGKWSLLDLQQMYISGNSLQDIAQIVPFRGGPCNRSIRCCGVCTRKCYHRCIQDCLHRIYMWKMSLDNGVDLPLAERYATTQKFENLAEMSWVVSEILSQSSNTKVRKYMQHENLRPEENPNKIDYAPSYAVDPNNGKRVVDISTGELLIRKWPESGLCPYCLPNATIDRRYARSKKTSNT
jgi:hypothetical protein